MPASQAGRRRFDPGLPLQFFNNLIKWSAPIVMFPRNQPRATIPGVSALHGTRRLTRRAITSRRALGTQLFLLEGDLETQDDLDTGLGDLDSCWFLERKRPKWSAISG